MSREWVTVPAEPTPEMVEEICRSHTTEEWPNAFGASAQEIRRDYARAGWAAALAAAPHPPIAQPDVLRAAAEKARAALSDLLLKRDPIVYSDALRALDEALAQAPIAQTQAAGWRPIETAPKGERVLLVNRSGRVQIGDWDWYDVHNDPGFTHWQPLGREAAALLHSTAVRVRRSREDQLTTDHTPAAAPSAPAPAEVPMPEPDQTDVDCELWGQNAKVDVWYRESVLTYAAGREAAALERVRGVLRELVESYRSLINTLGHEDATAADEEKAEARFACAEAAARAELGEKP